ncbi:MAG: hypothetical protein ACFFD9_01475 [Candidatus Thorarchaeota archaeon]
MTFRYSERVGYTIFILNLLAPFTAMIQPLPSDEVIVVVSAPLWQYRWYSAYPPSFALSPFGLLFFPYYGPIVYVAWLAYNTSRKQHLEPRQYAWRIVAALAIQIALIIVIPPSSGDPQPVNLPLPIVGVLALFLTRFTVKELAGPWEVQEASDS